MLVNNNSKDRCFMNKIIGIMGPNNASKENLRDTYEIGKYVANKGYTVLTGGLNVGVQNKGLKGAKSSNGLTIGIMPFNEPEKFSEYVDIPIITNMRSGRNYINVSSSNLVIACEIDVGTISEISLSLVKTNNKKVILVGTLQEANDLFTKLKSDNIFIAKDYNECINIFERIEF